MKKILLLLVFMLIPAFAEAQTSLSVDFHKAKFIWTWVQGSAPNEGIPTEFRVKCGSTSGTYPTVKIVPFPTLTTPKEIKVDQVVSSPGSYFCIVTAADQFGESGPSNEVAFQAGTIPTAPSNLSIQAQ